MSDRFCNVLLIHLKNKKKHEKYNLIISNYHNTNYDKL
jgi:hypothetical protein